MSTTPSKRQKRRADRIAKERPVRGFLTNGNTYIFLKEWEFKWGRIVASMRRTKGLGRFGGGWQWSLGFRATKRVAIFDLLVMSLRIERKRKDEVVPLADR